MTDHSWMRTFYEPEIRRFFEGEDVSVSDNVQGHVWVSRHKGGDALTVEPVATRGGGQYEIAVRFRVIEEELRYVNGEWRKVAFECWGGYIAGDGYLLGVHTGGH